MDYVESFMTEELKDHVLIELPSAEGGVRAFWLRKPGTGMYALLVTFVPGRIVLTGDLTIGGNHGCASAAGYGLDWWVSQLDGDYLCSKFLEKKWQGVVALRDLETKRDDAIRDGETAFAEKWQAVLDAWDEDDDMCPDDVIRAMDEAGITDAWDYSIGMDYDSGAGWLIAAHQKFRELWLARAAVPA